MRFVATFVALIAGFVFVAGVAEGRSRADLSVTKVGAGPAEVAAGGTLKLKVSIKNRGKARVRKAKITVRIGLAGGTAFGKPVGSARLNRIPGKGTLKVKVKVGVPGSIAPGSWRLTACVLPAGQKNDCKTGKSFKVVDRSSWALIEAAEAAGTLSPGKALLYQLYAVDGDKRLPKAYRGPGDLPTGVIFAELVSEYPNLSAAEQAKLLPYMLQPGYRQSAWSPKMRGKKAATVLAYTDDDSAGTSALNCDNLDYARGAWVGVEARNAWFWVRPGKPAVRARAKALAREFDSKIWPKLTGAFKSVRDSGGAAGCDPVGDSKLDIYLAPTVKSDTGTALGIAAPFANGTCGPMDSFIVLEENPSRSTLAHEFMHTIQFKYPVCDRYSAWTEGTAAWAEDFVYPRDQGEHAFASGILVPYLSMVSSNNIGYGAWTFWYSLRKKESIAGIQRVFDALATKKFPEALETGPRDGLTAAWKRYAMQRWNQSPVGATGFPEPKSFKDSAWDSFKLRPLSTPAKIELGGASKKEFDLTTGDRDRLTTFYHDIKISDPKVKHITFENGGTGRAGSVVQAFIKLANGKWKYEDWSAKPSIVFCLDKPDQNVVKLIVATSNASPRGGPLGAAEHQVTAKNACSLPASYSGTASGTATYDSSMLGPGNSASANWSGTVNLARIDTGLDDYPAYYQVDKGAGGTLQYSVTGVLEGCQMAGQVNIDLSELGTYPIQVLSIFGGDPVTYDLAVPMGPGPPNFMVSRSDCPDPGLNTPINWYPPIGPIYTAKSAMSEEVGEGGGLSGSSSTTFPVAQTSTWNLTPGG